MTSRPRLEDCHRLIALAKEAPSRICDIDGQWRLSAAREAVHLSPEPIPNDECALHLQHCLRDGLIALKDLPPGTRVQTGRGLRELAMSLVLILHARGFSPANIPPPKMNEVPAGSPRYNPGVDP
jgi:hypothetical protein